MRSLRCAAVALLSLLGALPGVTGERLPPPPGHSMAVLAHGVPEELSAGSLVQLTVELRNDGPAAWSPEEGYALAYHWLAGTGEVVVWDGMRSPLGQAVASGESVVVEARVKVPAREGRYRLQWDVVHEGVCWVSQHDPSPPPSSAVTVVVTHAFEVIDADPPRWLWVGGEKLARLQLRNDGTTTWRAEEGFRAAYHWLGPAGVTVRWEGLRTDLPRAVPPGGSVVLEALVRAPDEPGRFLLQWDMVQEGVCWFSELESSPPRPRSVIVVSASSLIPPLWTAFSVCVVVGVVWVRRRGGSQRLVASLALADVLWACGSVFVKQGAVLAESGHPASPGSGWVVAVGVAVMALVLVALPPRLRPWCSWAAVALVTLVLFADLVYLRYFGDLISISVLGAAGQTGEVVSSVVSLLAVHDVWLWADVVVGLALAAAVVRLGDSPARRARRPLAVALVAVLVLATGAALHIARRDSGVLRQVFRNVFLASEIGVLNFHLLDVGRFLASELLRAELDADEVAEVATWFRERAPHRAAREPWAGCALGKNLLLVQVESLQAFVLGFEINGQEVTPFLNRWLGECVWFPALADQTHHGRSSDCELTTQVSLLPPSHGTAAFLYPGNDYTGLAELLSQQGYTCLSAVAFDGSFWNRRTTHAAYGFPRSLFDTDFSPGEVIGWGLNDRSFLTQMVPRLEDLQRPFCAWLITLSLHHPFAGFPSQHEVLDVGPWEDTPFGNYLHTMRFFDGAWEVLVSELRARGLLEETVIVLWGDHDAGLGWEPEMAEALGTRWHEPDWYLTERVPLIIRVPGVPELRGVRTVAAGQADVAPTLLPVLGVDPASYAFVGRNLLGEPDDDPVPGAYGSWVDRQHLYVPHGSSLAEGRCYELATLEQVDPEACRPGQEAVERQREVSRQVLVHDLQQRLHDLLRDEQ